VILGGWGLSRTTRGGNRGRTFRRAEGTVHQGAEIKRNGNKWKADKIIQGRTEGKIRESQGKDIGFGKRVVGWKWPPHVMNGTDALIEDYWAVG